MTKIPISCQKIKLKARQNTEAIKYLLTISEKGEYFDKSLICERSEILKLRDHLDAVLSDINTAELLGISQSQAEIIEQFHSSDELCKGCEFKMSKHCITCLIQLQSPIERKLFLALNRANIYFLPQYALDRFGKSISVEGKSYYDPKNNFKDVLTIVDFFIERNGLKICVYTDGHNYHERTEEQAQRDRNIDRKLQEFGYKVLRFTGKEVNSDVERIVNDIKGWIH